MINENTEIEKIIETLRYWLEYNIKHITPVRPEILACVGNLLDKVEKQGKELETYKKIAEKLADTIQGGIFSYNDVCDKVSDEECNKRRCYQCIIDWARNEVLKDE